MPGKRRITAREGKTGHLPTELGQERGVLQDDPQRLRALVEANPFPVLITRATDATILYANQEFELVVGVPALELVGRKSLEYYPSPGEWEAILAALPSEGRLDGYEAQGRRQDGSVFWTAAWVRSILFAGVQAICITFQVSNEQKRVASRGREEAPVKEAERELTRLSESKCADILDSISDGFYALDGRLTLTYFNKAAEQFLGLGRDVVLGRNLFEAFPRLLGTTAEERLNWVLYHQKPASFELSIPGQPHVNWYEVRAYPRGDGVSVYFEVTTERKRQEEQLLAAQKLLEKTFASLSDALFILSPSGADRVIVMCNPAVQTVFGYRPEELIGRTTEVLHVDRESYRQFGRMLDAGSAKADVLYTEYPMRRRDGTIIHVENTVTKILDDQGRMTSAVSVARDITQRKHAEEDINQRARELTAYLDITLRMGGELDLDAQCRGMVQSIVETLAHAHSAALWLYVEQRDQLVVQAWAGYDDVIVTRSALAPGAGLVGLVYRTGQPQIIHDAAGEVAQLPWPYPELNAGRSRSAIGVPLISDARPIGVLMAANSSSTGAFSAHDLRVLQPLAVKAANSIENARLYEQVRAGREQLRRLSLQLMEAQEAERRSLAAELHDEIGQVLTAIKTNLQATQLQPDPSTLTRRLQDSIAIVDRALEQVRELALDLRPSLLDDFGLVAALEWLVERLGERSGIRAEFLAEPHDLRLAPAVETAFFRIAQAALTNVERHAQAKRVRVELRRVPVPPAEAPGRVELVISDDGQGFEVPAAMEHAVRGASLGLLGMQERVRQAGGEIAIESEPGRGTTVRVTYPAGA